MMQVRGSGWNIVEPYFIDLCMMRASIIKLKLTGTSKREYAVPIKLIPNKLVIVIKAKNLNKNDFCINY